MKVGDKLRSHNGCGPWTATIRRFEGATVHLLTNRSCGVDGCLVRLPTWFLSSPACGWKPANVAAKAEAAVARIKNPVARRAVFAHVLDALLEEETQKKPEAPHA